MDTNADQQPAASSKPSRQKGKPRTEITLQDAIGMLNSAKWYYQKAGGVIRIGNSQSQEQTALMALPGVRVCQRCSNLTLFEQMVGDVCGACAKA